MKIIDKLNQKGIHISFEVFPPKTDADLTKYYQQQMRLPN